jgi:hypothetical protein
VAAAPAISKVAPAEAFDPRALNWELARRYLDPAAEAIANQIDADVARFIAYECGRGTGFFRMPPQMEREYTA